MKPNVLFLISDQHNRQIAGFTGNRIISTPNLDRLASESMQFENAYCQFPLCTPSRISMWTGLLPHRAGAWKNNLPIVNPTIPEHFAEHGYVTCGVGKMHIGGERPMNGFRIRPYGDLKPNRFCSHQPDPLQTARTQEWTSHKVGRFPFAGESEIPEDQLQERIVTKESLAFIREHADQPWFVCASYSRPHHPLTAPPRFLERHWPHGPQLHPWPKGFPDDLHPHDRFIVEDFGLARFSEADRRRGLAAYYASVSFLDDCIGELLAGLDDLLDNTIIIYTSDHGDMASEHGLWWKRSFYDGSAGVPLLIRVPGQAVSKRADVVELLDLFPSLCHLCGLPTPDALDGETLFAGRTKDFARSQLVERPETTFRMVRTPEWKYVEFPEYPPVLFDMANDPGEERNVAGLAEVNKVEADLHKQLWSDGESWESLFDRRNADLERANRGLLHYEGVTPNQYALPDGTVVDAETELYSEYLKES
ncbi:MAG TPA: sulfatase-like hydrolase/transferase [Armatimonadota bacterium]|nr:sulfatase-like hydrolase/transferase [Armatimonadota bacterium]